MERLDKVIDLYLKMETNYALVITGEWGKGKTYYYKNVIEPQIIQTDSTPPNKYKSLVISLFGQKSIEDIQTDIFLALHNPFKSKTGKIATNITRVLAKGIMKVTNLDKYYDVVSEAASGVSKGDLISLEDTVLCLDDVERISDGLNIEELIGFINTLVENNGAKVILIINEDKVNNKEKYFQFKEKIAGNSIEFNPNILSSLTNIIESKFTEETSYKKFLLEKRDFIVEAFGKGSTNLRTLNFIITYFQEIFSQIETQLTNKQEKLLFEKKDEILLNLLKFCITISIEYKEAIVSSGKRISYKERGGLDWSADLVDWENVMHGLTTSAKKDEEKSYRQLLIEKYYDNKNFYFYPSVYNFLTGGDIFICDFLIKELRQIYKINENNVILPQNIVYGKLGFPHYLDLKDDEYLVLTKELLKYSDKGELYLPVYVTVFYFATRFGNPLKYDPDKLEKRIIKGMLKGKKGYAYLNSLDMHFNLDLNTENKEHFANIITAINGVNEELRKSKESKDCQKLEDLFYSDFDEFYKQALILNAPFAHRPFFNHFKLNRLYSHLMSDNKKRWDFTACLRQRYTNNSSYSLRPEIDFLTSLQQKISKNSKTISGKNVTGFVFTELNKQLLTVIEKLKTNN
jgi:hypothetical protein